MIKQLYDLEKHYRSQLLQGESLEAGPICKIKLADEDEPRTWLSEGSSKEFFVQNLRVYCYVNYARIEYICTVMEAWQITCAIEDYEKALKTRPSESEGRKEVLNFVYQDKGQEMLVSYDIERNEDGLVTGFGEIMRTRGEDATPQGLFSNILSPHAPARPHADSAVIKEVSDDLWKVMAEAGEMCFDEDQRNILNFADLTRKLQESLPETAFASKSAMIKHFAESQGYLPVEEEPKPE